MVYTEREDNFLNHLKQLDISKEKEEVVHAFHLADKYFMREHPGLLGKSRDLYMNQYRDYLFEQLALKDIPEFTPNKNQSRKRGWQCFPFTHNTLQGLKDQGYTLGLISNWNETADAVLAENALTQYFNPIIISSKLGIEKPDPRIFEEALKISGFSSKECLYVGDNYYDDVIGAREVAMDSVLINPYGKLGIEELDDAVTVIKSIEALPSILKKS